MVLMDDAVGIAMVYSRISSNNNKSGAKAAALKRNITVTSMLLNTPSKLNKKRLSKRLKVKPSVY